MNCSLTIKNSDVNVLKYTHGKFYPRNLISSEDGFLAIVHLDSVVIGTIGFQPLNNNKKYILSKFLIDIDFTPDRSTLMKADIDMNFLKLTKVSDPSLYPFMKPSCESRLRICYVDWSPLDTLINNCYLAIMTFDGRLVILKQNKVDNRWEKEFDLLLIYYNFYKENLSISDRDKDGKISFQDQDRFIQYNKDVNLIAFSWSKLVRQSNSNQYCLLSVLSESGILSIWQLINGNVESRCQIIFHCRLDRQAKTLQFCDFSHGIFFVTVFYGDERIVSYGYEIHDLSQSDKLDNNVVNIVELKPLSNCVCELNHQSKFTQVNKFHWSVKHRTLLVGYESELFVARFDEFRGDIQQIRFRKKWLNLPSSEEISGIVVNGNQAYMISRDGYLFIIDLSHNNSLEDLQCNEVLFENNAVVSCSEFIDLFISPNGVHLGLLTRKHTSTAVRCDKLSTTCHVVLIRLVSQSHVLSILMDDNIAFSRKQDAVEDLRNQYTNDKHVVHGNLHRLVMGQIDWETSSLHNLQFVRYIYAFFGYPLNVNHEFIDRLSVTSHRDGNVFCRIRQLEKVIISRNLSYWLEGFIDLVSVKEINKGDCFFVLSLCIKFLLLSCKEESIVESIELARDKSRSLLRNEFLVNQSEIDLWEMEAGCTVCPVCDERLSQFNLFASKCSNCHVIPRCCKSLELCTDQVKICILCGAMEKFVDFTSSGLSTWRWEIVNSNCPLCDGIFVKSNF